MAFFIEFIFLSKPLDDNPAPLPVTSSTFLSKRTAAIALLVVVLPIPISPVAIIPYPLSFKSLTILIPHSTASIAVYFVIAGSLVIFLVPYINFFSIRPSIYISFAMPISTGITSTFTHFAILLTDVSPLTIFAATIAVTSCPVCVTPSSTTPLSAHITTTARFLRFTLGFLVIPAILITTSSNRPKPLSGFAILFQRFSDTFIASISSSLITDNISFK